MSEEAFNVTGCPAIGMHAQCGPSSMHSYFPQASSFAITDSLKGLGYVWRVLQWGVHTGAAVGGSTGSNQELCVGLGSQFLE